MILAYTHTEQAFILGGWLRDPLRHGRQEKGTACLGVCFPQCTRDVVCDMISFTGHLLPIVDICDEHIAFAWSTYRSRSAEPVSDGCQTPMHVRTGTEWRVH